MVVTGVTPGKTGMLEILHFNDVYEMEERTVEPVAGVARFIGLVNQLRHPDGETPPRPTLQIGGELRSAGGLPRYFFRLGGRTTLGMEE